MSKIITLETLETYNNNLQQVIDERYYTKREVDELLSNYVSLETVQQMIADAIANLNNPEDPETPVDPEPDTPVEPEDPETPVDPSADIGFVNWNGMMYIKDKDLANGQYIFRYIDTNDNIIDNFNPIMTFDVDHTNEPDDMPSVGIS